MPRFSSDGLTLAYESYGEGAPVLLIHGFGSNGVVNWVETGWTTELADAGYRAITIDNRGHGASDKPHDPQAYRPALMAGDAVKLLDTLEIAQAPIIGYSMGARIAAFLALASPERVRCAVLGGMAANLTTGMADSEEIIAALVAPSLAEVSGRTGRQFRAFAERTGADREALAACMETSREPMPAADVGRIRVPVLVAAGSEDTMAGPAESLAQMLPRGEAFTIEGRDHMRTSGDPEFKAAALAFLSRHTNDGGQSSIVA